MGKVPTRSPSHEEVELNKLASMGMEVDELMVDDAVPLKALIELAEDRGRQPSHYLAATALATDGDVEVTAAMKVRVCAGSCQKWGSLDLLDHLAERWTREGGARAGFCISVAACLDRCDQASAAEIHGDHGVLVIAEATPGKVDEALRELLGASR